MEQFRPDLSDAERIEVMQNTAEKVEDTRYYVQLTNDELDIKREQLTENLIALDVENEEFDVLKERHKATIKPLQAENSILIAAVRTGQEQRDGIIYHMPNYENGMMETYDQKGFMVSSRRLRPEEKQGSQNMFISKKAS